MSRRDTTSFLLWLLVFGMLTTVAAFSGAKFGPGEWYDAIRKPDWTPEDWVFPVVWTTLYVMIALAGALVWTAASNRAFPALLWFAQLLVNGLWSWVFFDQHRIDAGMLTIAVLVVLVAAFIWSARKASTIASLLFIPYLAWVCLAFALNTHIWALNEFPSGVFEPLMAQ